MLSGTTRHLPRMPMEVAPLCTAWRAYSIWTSLPEGLKVVRLKL